MVFSQNKTTYSFNNLSGVFDYAFASIKVQTEEKISDVGIQNKIEKKVKPIF